MGRLAVGCGATGLERTDVEAQRWESRGHTSVSQWKGALVARVTHETLTVERPRQR